MAVKHVEIAFDESSQKFRIKDGSESVSYANFLQFDTIQQLLDQCKQHPTLGITLDKYPSIQAVDELWKMDWNDIFTVEELKCDLPWVIMEGKFGNQNALIHVQQIGCTDSVKEAFTNQSRILMTLCHENVVDFYGTCSKGSRVCMVHSYYPNGSLSDYLMRNAALLVSHPSELINITTQILSGMVYLEECGVVHGELITDNCIIGDKGVVKICGFHCASSLWCSKPIEDQLYSNKVPLSAPELDEGSKPSSTTDVWAFGLLVYTIITAGQKPIRTVEQVLTILNCEDFLEELEGFVEVMTSCLRMDSSSRPTFVQLLQRCGPRNRFPSTPSASSYSLDLEDSFSSSTGTLTNGLDYSMSSEILTKESSEKKPDDESKSPSLSQSESTSNGSRDTNELRFTSNDVVERLKSAELEALKAKALQRRAEADKEEILKQVREAEKKCLKEVELITRTFICRLNEANDRAADANEMRYVAEEAKRLAEEKFTLFKYESEKTIHDIKTMLEETMLERDELAESLKSFGMNIDNNNIKSVGTQERRDSLGDLEKKYQRFISTSDRTIQNMKSQIDEVVNQRDSLTEELNVSREDLRETRDLLEHVIKEKEDLAFRLDESNCVVEKLEETISSMVHKRQKAERERDQLQILTDMSLMKLRHAEKPKKRHSVGSVVTSCEKKDPNLRRLSMQLMNLRTPTSKRRQSEDVIYEVSEHSSSDETAFSNRNESEYDSPSRTSSKEQEMDQPELCAPVRCSTPSDNEAELISSLSSLTSNSYIMDILSKEHQSNETHNDSEELAVCETTQNDDNEQHSQSHLDEINEKHVMDNHDFNGSDDNDSYGNGSHGSSDDDHCVNPQLEALKNPNPFSIPTVLIDEFAEENGSINKSQKKQSIPDIEISLVDDGFTGNGTGNGYFSEDEATSERVFIVPFENGDTSMVFSFDSEGGAKKGVPQTVL